MSHQGVEELGRADDVDQAVPVGLGQGLAGAGLGGEVEDDVGTDAPVPEEEVPKLFGFCFERKSR